MSDFKYVVLKSGGYEFPVIFPDKLAHVDVANHLKSVTPGWDKGKPVTTVAAGFVNLDMRKCYGESESLGGLKSRPGDWDLINWYPYGHGYVGSEDDA